MNLAHLLFIPVCALALGFMWQLRRELTKMLYFALGIGVGCAMIGLLTH
jgi:hypothetical protein